MNSVSDELRAVLGDFISPTRRELKLILNPELSPEYAPATKAKTRSGRRRIPVSAADIQRISWQRHDADLEEFMGRPVKSPSDREPSFPSPTETKQAILTDLGHSISVRTIISRLNEVGMSYPPPRLPEVEEAE